MVEWGFCDFSILNIGKYQNSHEFVLGDNPVRNRVRLGEDLYSANNIIAMLRTTRIYSIPMLTENINSMAPH